MKVDNKKDVLFCVMPNISLWRRYPIIEMPFGSSIVASGLLKNGFSVEYIDLNAQINSWQNEVPLLSQKTLRLLENWEKIAQSSTSLPLDLTEVIKRLIAILSLNDFSYVAFSLNRITIDNRVINASLGFAAIFSQALKKIKNCNVIVGGQVLAWIGFEKIYSSLKKKSQPIFDFIFFDDGATTLPHLLTSLECEDKKLCSLSYLQRTGQRIIHFSGQNTINKLSDLNFDNNLSLQQNDLKIKKALLQIEPTFNISNFHLYSNSFDSIFPIELHKDWTHQPIRILPYKFIYGCTHKCAFCKSAYDKPIYQSAKLAVNEIEKYVKEYGIKSFRFFNSQLNFSKKYVTEFCRELIARKLDVQFSDSASLRNLSFDICQYLREAGCVKLWLGIESPNDRILKMINKELDVKTINESLLNAHKAGIWIGSNIIVGFPYETEDEFHSLLSFINTYKDIINCWQISPLELHKNTPFYNNPQDYSIAIHELYSKKIKMRGFAFSEAKGLDWKKRLKQSLIRVDLCYDAINSTRNRFYSNDYLVFVMYNAFHSKDVVKQEIDKYLKKIKHNLNLREASRWLNYNDVHNFDYSLYLKHF